MWYMDEGVLGHPTINTYRWKKYMCPSPWLVGRGYSGEELVGEVWACVSGGEGGARYLNCSIGVSWRMLSCAVADTFQGFCLKLDHSP